MSSFQRRNRFHWKRFVVAALILFVTLEFAGISLTLVGLLAWQIAEFGYRPSAADLDPGTWFRFTVTVGGFGLVLTAIPAALYSLIAGAVFARFRWTRRWFPALGFSLLLTLAMFGAGIVFLGGGDPGLVILMLLSSLGTTAVGTWVLLRYFKTVERNDLP